MAKENKLNNDNEIVMLLDSGASEHFISGEDLLRDVKSLNVPKIIECANDDDLNVRKYGDLYVVLEEGERMLLTEVYAHQDFAVNLLSVRKLCSKGYHVVFKEDMAYVNHKCDNQLLLKIPMMDNAWKLLLSVSGDMEKSSVFAAKQVPVERKRKSTSDEPGSYKVCKLEETSEGMRWHQRLGHSKARFIQSRTQLCQVWK